MLYHLEQYISNSVTQVFTPAIGQRTKFAASMTTSSISTANANRDGTGTIVNLITGVNTLVHTITIAATGNTTLGMVRLYLRDLTPTFTNLIAEIPIPETTRSATDKAFSIMLQVDFILKTDYRLAASTQNGETFSITVESSDMTYP